MFGGISFCFSTWTQQGFLRHTCRQEVKRLWLIGQWVNRSISQNFCSTKQVWFGLYSSQFSSVTQSYLTLCDSMDCSSPGFPVHHQLPELTQTHVHRVGDAIQPSHPLSSPLLLPSIFPRIRVFSNESVRIRWPNYWSFSFSIIPSKEHLGLISCRMDGLDLLAVKSLLQHHSSQHQFLSAQLSFQFNSHIHT